MKARLHISQVNTLGVCAMQYYWRYAEEKCMPPGWAAVRGTGAHAGTEHNLRHKVYNAGIAAPLDDVLDKAAMAVELEVNTFGIVADEGQTESSAAGKAKDGAVAMAEKHYTDLAPSIEPVHVERPFLLEIANGEVDLAGTVDCMTADEVIDLKTSSKTPGGNPADTSIQLTMYSMAREALDETSVSVRLDYLVGLKKGIKVARFSSTRGHKDYDTLLLRIHEWVRCIKAGIFPPAPHDHWVCQEKYCGYWKDICPYGRRGRTVG